MRAGLEKIPVRLHDEVMMLWVSESLRGKEGGAGDAGSDERKTHAAIEDAGFMMEGGGGFVGDGLEVVQCSRENHVVVRSVKRCEPARQDVLEAEIVGWSTSCRREMLTWISLY